MERLAAIAKRLLEDGTVDNVPDAYLAAIRIVVAAELLAETEVPPPQPLAGFA
jgi:hypothetical protein